MNKINIKNHSRIAGLAVKNARKGELVPIWQKGLITSDNEDFSKLVSNFTSPIFNKVGIIEDGVIQFLLIQHRDCSIDIWVNNFDKHVEARVKRSIKKGEFLYTNNIADIRRLKFPEINIRDDDNIAFGFKVGWKMGFYIDLTRIDEPQKVNNLYLDLGRAYKQLSFSYLFEIFKKNLDHQIFQDGWFPFIELIGQEYKNIVDAYQADFAIKEKMSKLLDKFDDERIKKNTDKWWSLEILDNKKEILDSGIESLLKNDNSGNILAIKVFFTEAEGVIRSSYFQENENDPKRKTNILWEYLENRAKIRSGCEDSLFFGTQFSEFLQKHIYKQFNLEKGEISVSRHTVSHGVADAKDYNRAKAIQGLLILDQLFFFLS